MVELSEGLSEMKTFHDNDSSHRPEATMSITSLMFDSQKTKRKRSSKTAELETCINTLEIRFDNRFDQLFDLLKAGKASRHTETSISQTGGLATQKNEVRENVSSWAALELEILMNTLFCLCTLIIGREPMYWV